MIQDVQISAAANAAPATDMPGFLDPIKRPEGADPAPYKVLFLPGAQARTLTDGTDFQSCVLNYVGHLYTDVSSSIQSATTTLNTASRGSAANRLDGILKADLQTLYYPGLVGEQKEIVEGFQSNGSRSYLATQAQLYANQLIDTLGITQDNYLNFRFVGYSFGGLILHYLSAQLADMGLERKRMTQPVNPEELSFITFGDAACATCFVHELNRAKKGLTGIRIGSLDDRILFPERKLASSAATDEIKSGEFERLVFPRLGHYRDLFGKRARFVHLDSPDGHNLHLYLAPSVKREWFEHAADTRNLSVLKGTTASAHLLVGTLRQMLVAPWNNEDYVNYLLEDLAQVSKH